MVRELPWKRGDVIKGIWYPCKYVIVTNMIPNRIVRYFMFLGYALGHGGLTSFPTFQNGVTQFYFEYLDQQYYLTQPAYYPKNYGIN